MFDALALCFPSLLLAVLLGLKGFSSHSLLSNIAVSTSNSIDSMQNRGDSNARTAQAEATRNNAGGSLPPLTDHEERQYNQFARKMTHFHTYLQREYETAYELADGSFSKRGMSLIAYLDSVDEFRTHLTTHHDIEEVHIFPVLGKRMPEFRPNERHKTSHKLIHDGLDQLEAIVQKFRETPSTYKPEVMRNTLDSFRDVLYHHLAEEVRDLSAENMRKYWTISELSKIPF